VVSEKTGGIREWIEDYDEFEIGHRHVSHLYSVYPGTAISPEKTPELAAAAEKTLERRLNNGYDGQGWSLGWIANIYARLGKGDKVHAILEDIAQHHILQNLMINAHGNPQVGDAQATPAAMLEALAQSHGEDIVLLPALPPQWNAGKVTGMRLRGGRALDMEWSDGRVVHARVYTLDGNELSASVWLADKNSYEVVMAPGEIVFTQKG
jgi:alpha-L-fucosidase 2